MLKTKNLLALGLTLTGTLVSLALARPTQAQTFAPELDLTVKPATAYRSVAPGDTLLHSVILESTGTEPLLVTPEIKDFYADGVSGQPIIKDKSSFPHIELDDPQRKLGQVFELPAGHQVELKLKIQPPETVIEKDYPLVLTLKAKPQTEGTGDEIGTGSQTSAIMASNLILTVSSGGQTEGLLEIKQIKAPKIIDSFAPLQFAVVVENVGANAWAAKGKVELTNWKKQLKEWYLAPDVVLAKSTREIRLLNKNPEELQKNEKIEIVEANYQDPFMFGPYTLTTTLENKEGDIERLSTTVIALPLSILLLIAVGVVLLAGYKFWERRNMLEV